MGKMNDWFKKCNEDLNKIAIYSCRTTIPNENFAENWHRFLSMDKPEEKKRINNIVNKKADKLTREDIHDLSEYNTRHIVANLFPKYDREECTPEEHKLVSDYMKKHDLEDVIYSLLTEDEKRDVATTLEVLEDWPYDKKFKIVNYLSPMYSKLNLIDCYVLRKLYAMAKQEANDEATEKMLAETAEANRSLIKHLHNDGYL